MTKTIREAFGESLVYYGKTNNKVVVLDSDVSSSTKTCYFASQFPERFYNLGVAEANMVGVAAGMASVGKIPFANTFAVFITSNGLLAARTFGSYASLNIKLCGAYSGLSDSYDGPSHHSLEDLAIMRSLPGFEVYVTSDEYLTKWIVENAINRIKPMYIRLSRGSMPIIYNEKTQFISGHGKQLRKGKDAVIISCGIMASKSLQAASNLASKNLEVGVVDMFCIKPIDTKLIIDCAKTGAIITAEEHNIIGGLGSSVSEVLSRNGLGAIQEFVGMNDMHAECGPYDVLMKDYNMDVTAIEEAVMRAILKKEGGNKLCKNR